MDRIFRLLLFCLFAAEQCLSSFGMDHDHTSSESGSSMFFFQDHSYPRDCGEVQNQCSGRNATGAHLIRPDGYHEPFWVSCSGEWTVLQRRYNLLLDFDRNWTEYQEGFGYLNAEHWLGNEKIAQLTNQKPYELRIEFETKSGTKAFISYDGLRINDEFGDFRLVGLGHRSGIADADFTTCPSDAEHCFRDCYDVWRAGNTASGDYTITPTRWSRELTVNCNMTVDGGGWTVIQRRILSSTRQSFDQDWETYKNGFGDPSGEFWIGNEQLYYLTNQRKYELRIDVVTTGHDSYYAKYEFFRINDENDKYRLSALGDMTGTAGQDSLRPHVGVYFSTPDRDNDVYYDPDTSCADYFNAGWWYYYCYNIDLNNGYSDDRVGHWYRLLGSTEDLTSLSYTEMKIRPIEAN